MRTKYCRKRVGVAGFVLLACGTAYAQDRAGAATVEPSLSTETELTVTATGEATRAATVLIMRAGVVTLAPTAAGALSDNVTAMTRVQTVLRRAGVAERDITTTSVQLSPKYNFMNGIQTITGYVAANTVSVRFNDVKRSGPVLDAMVAAGANKIDGPLLRVADPDAALDEARADAVKRARARAEIYAQAAGMHVVRTASISEAGYYTGDRDPFLMPDNNVVAEDAGSLPSTRIQAGEKKVTASVTMRFLLR